MIMKKLSKEQKKKSMRHLKKKPFVFIGGELGKEKTI